MSTVINPSLNNFLFDLSYDPRVLGRLKLPYKSLNFLAILSRQTGVDKYDRATEIIELCHWIYNQVSDVRNIINRLAEYAITDLQIDDTHTKLTKDEQQTLLRALEVIGIKSTLVEAAKLYFATGNVLCSVENRFKKNLKCPKCKITVPITSIDATYDVTQLKFKANCVDKRCNFTGFFEEIDQKIRRAEDIFIRLWDWREIDFTYNPISDEYKYFHKIPSYFSQKLLKGKPDTFLLQTTPKDILEEIFIKGRNQIATSSVKGKVVGFKPGKIKHVKRPSTISSVMEGWGEPVTVGVLQDSFFMMLLRQAQATLLTDYIIPIRIVSPDPSAKDMMDISQFAMHFDRMYDSFQKDPMQIMKFPFPIQYQTLSGEAKQFFLSNEIDYTRQAIRRGVGLPSELLDGGLQNFSAGSISLRMLENFFINFTKNVIVDLVNNFIIPQVCIILDIPPFRVEMAKFKMIDDINQKQAVLDLFDRNLIADTQIYDQYNIERPSDRELNESVQRKGQRDRIYQIELAEAQAEGASLLAERQISDQFRFQDMQTKNNELQAAKQTESQVDPNTQGTESQMEGNVQPTMTTSGEQLPDPNTLAQDVLNQLQSPEEINNFMELLGKRVSDPKYLEQVKASIEHNTRATQLEQAQSQAQQQMADVQQKAQNPGQQQPGVKKKQRTDKRPPSDQKPQRRDNPV
jgi:hypothetical protein